MKGDCIVGKMARFSPNFLRTVTSQLFQQPRTFVSKAPGGQQTSRRHTFDYFLVVDFEATCDKGRLLEPQEIIEFPVLKVNARSLDIESQFHRYVRPIFHPELTSFCTNLTGIIQDMVDNEQTFDQVLLQFEQWLFHEELLKHNFAFVTCGDWDLRQMLPHQCKLLSIPVPPYFQSWINIKQVFAECTDKFPRTLPDMLEHFQLKVHGKLHSGIDDCYNIARLLKPMDARYACQMKVTGRLKQGSH